MPMVDVSFIVYEIYVLFDYYDEERDTVNVWFQGKVVSIDKKNANVVEIKWREE